MRGGRSSGVTGTLKQNRQDMKRLVNPTTLNWNRMDAALDRKGRFCRGIGRGFLGRIVRLSAGEGAINHALKHGYERISLHRTLNVGKASLPTVRSKQLRFGRTRCALHQGIT